MYCCGSLVAPFNAPTGEFLPRTLEHLVNAELSRDGFSNFGSLLTPVVNLPNIVSLSNDHAFFFMRH